MKTSTLVKTLIACIALANAGLVMAGTKPMPTGNKGTLIVTGTVVPKACSFQWPSQEATVDFGEHAENELQDNQMHSLGSRPVPFAIDCSSPTQVSLSAEDARKGSVPQYVSLQRSD